MKTTIVVLSFLLLIGCTTPLTESDSVTEVTIYQVDRSIHYAPYNKEVAHSSTPPDESTTGIEEKCPVFELPDFGEMPKIPPIDDAKRGDYEYITNIMIDYTQSLSNFIQGQYDLLLNSYSEYQKECGVSQ